MELMIIIAMIAILAAFTVQGFIKYITYFDFKESVSVLESNLMRTRVMAIKKASEIDVTFFEDENKYVIQEQNCDIADSSLQCWQKNVDIKEKYGNEIKLVITSAHDDPAKITFNSKGMLNTAATLKVEVDAGDAKGSFIITPMGVIITEIDK